MVQTTKPKLNKSKLIFAVQALLQNNTVSTQEELCEALEKKGFTVNQVQISRLLHKLGAIKVTEGDNDAYRLPPEPRFSARDPLKQLVLHIHYNESLVVIQTAPGSAPAVARLLDLKKQPEVLGTVAGDDTIFVAPTKEKYIKDLFQKIQTLLLS